MRNVLTIFRREFVSYFTTPLAYVFIVIFLVLAGMLTFFVGNFFDRGQADLQPFFAFHPWLYLVLIPALSMRLWAEERKSGTIELFLTLPIRMTEAVVGKFLAAWCFAGIALALTFPFWITVNLLGRPDNGVIVASYIGSWLMAGALLAIGACVSAATKNQVIAFVVTAAIAFIFTVAGSPVVLGLLQGWAPEWLIGAVTQISFLDHFSAITRGVLDIRDLAYFVLIMSRFCSRTPSWSISKRPNEMLSSTGSPGLFGSRRAVAITALVCIALMLVSANIVIARFFSARLDLTAEHLYTLSPGTVHTLAQIDEPITLRFYYSNRLGDEVPAYGVYAQRVRELLEQYVAAAHGKLRLEIFNPQPFSDVEDRRSPSACRRCRSTARATRFISASPRPTRPTISRSSRSFRPSASAFSNTI